MLNEDTFSRRRQCLGLSLWVTCQALSKLPIPGLQTSDWITTSNAAPLDKVAVQNIDLVELWTRFLGFLEIEDLRSE